jgi:hypothetical protein
MCQNLRGSQSPAEGSYFYETESDIQASLGLLDGLKVISYLYFLYLFWLACR